MVGVEGEAVRLAAEGGGPGVHRGPRRRGGGIDAGEWQQRADRRVRLFLWTDDTVDPASRLLETPADEDLADA